MMERGEKTIGKESYLWNDADPANIGKQNRIQISGTYL
jgi:hypothetical protein